LNSNAPRNAEEEERMHKQRMFLEGELSKLRGHLADSAGVSHIRGHFY